MRIWREVFSRGGSVPWLLGGTGKAASVPSQENGTYNFGPKELSEYLTAKNCSHISALLRDRIKHAWATVPQLAEFSCWWRWVMCTSDFFTLLIAVWCSPGVSFMSLLIWLFCLTLYPSLYQKPWASPHPKYTFNSSLSPIHPCTAPWIFRRGRRAASTPTAHDLSIQFSGPERLGQANWHEVGCGKFYWQVYRG